MKKITRLLLLFCLLPFAAVIQAKHVTVEQALRTAAAYYEQKDDVTLRRGSAPSLKLAHTEAPAGVSVRSSSAHADGNACYYVFDIGNDGGFIIVSGDDRAYPVLGYVPEGRYDVSRMPPQCVAWLEMYRDEIASLIANNPATPVSPQWQALKEGVSLRSNELRASVAPLCAANWSQGDPYNRECPLFGGQRCVTGCTATAMAIVLKYHADKGKPAVGSGSHSYTWNGQTLSVNFGTYDWANMPNNTSDYKTEVQKAAIARLMYHCGVALEADYGTGGTSASTSRIADVLSFFGFEANSYKTKSDYTESEWAGLIKTELDQRRPINYRGQSSAGGHSFVLDGYTAAGEYHFNWGWGGSYNGNFRLTALQPGGSNFSVNQGMITGVRPSTRKELPNASVLQLTNIDKGAGMSMDVSRIIKGQAFTVSAKTVSNLSSSYTPCKIGVALFDAAGTLKEHVGGYEELEHMPPGSHFLPITFECTVLRTLTGTETLRMVSSADGGQTWKIIYGKTPDIIDSLSVGNQSVAVTGVSLNPTNLSLAVNGTSKLTATVAPANASNKDVTWKSSNTTVATVDATGLVTAKTVGTATITVTTADGGKIATCAVTVTTSTVAVTGVSLNASSQTFTEGSTFQLTASVAPANATNRAVTWSSSNIVVATVDSYGLVTAKTAGTATVIVTTADGGKTATCAITVTTTTVTVTGVSLNATSRTLVEGGTFQLEATVAPANATNKAITWSSSNTAVATVDANGLVIAKAAGTANVTVITADGGKTAICAITVTNAPVIGTDITPSFTDTNFRNAVYAVIGKTAPAPIYDIDVSGITSLNVSSKNIASLAGIQHFTSLRYLNCSGNQLSSLNVSGLTMLDDLQCDYNQLSSLNVSGLTNLRVLNCLDNQLPSLNVSGLTNLEWLDCRINQLSSLNVSGLTKLVTLLCFANQLPSLNVSGLTKLEHIYCSNNQLSSLNLSGLTRLVKLWCSGNQLSSLNVSGLTNLEDLDCFNNQLSFLNVSGLTSLEKLYCFDNQLSSLNILGLTNLADFRCHNNNMCATTDVTGWDNLKNWTFFPQNCPQVIVTGVSLNATSQSLVVGGTFQLTATVAPANATNKIVSWSSSNTAVATVSSTGLVTANSAGTATVTVITADGNKTATCAITVTSLGTDITSSFTDANFRNEVYAIIGKTAPAPIYDVDVSGITSLNVNSKNISSLAGIQHFTGLEFLFSNSNQLSSLNVSGLIHLRYVHCENNQLSSLNVSLTNLVSLYCNNNQLSSLNVSGLTNLNNLWCDGNQLSSLNVSGLTNLLLLACRNNRLSSLDASGVINLKQLYCSNNQLSSLNISGLTKLENIDCHNNKMCTTTDVTGWDNSKGWTFLPQNCPQTGTDITSSFTDANFRNEVYTIIGKTAPAPIYDVDVSGITSLNVNSKNISSLAGIEHFTDLWNLDCNDNQLSSLNVSGLTNLVQLDCRYNQLSSLNVSGLTKLDLLLCSKNELSSINLSGLTNLRSLYCWYNQLSSLDISSLTNLAVIDCGINRLSSLNVSGLINITHLVCYGNRLSSLNVSGLTNLQQLNCLNNQLSSLNLSGVANLQTLDCHNNNMCATTDVTGWDNSKGWVFFPQNCPTSSELAGASATEAVAQSAIRFYRGVLTVDTPVAEKITVYSVSGAAVFTARKPAGRETYNLSALPAGIYIVRGESGWTRKILKK